LASIETKEELEVVWAEVERVIGVIGVTAVWVGVKRISGANDFLWLTGSTLREEDEAWGSGSPYAADSGHDCVWMSTSWDTSTSNTFYDFPCTVHGLLPLCEMPGSYFLVIHTFRVFQSNSDQNLIRDEK
jgi:hypothetical protein